MDEEPKQLELLSSVRRLLEQANFPSMNGESIVNVARLILTYEHFVEAVESGRIVISGAPTDASS